MPAKPFGQTALLPERRQFLLTPWYRSTEFQNVWRGSQHENITVGDEHGFDQNNGMLLVEYGLKEKWAADLLIGYTGFSTRSTTPDGSVELTDGLMDVTFGVRWQVLNESECESKWAPTLTLRAGGVVNGTYDYDFPFAPGNGSVGVEPSVILLKSFGWEGFGMYGNLGYRNLRSGGNDQVFGSIGVSQRYNGFSFNAGYRHQQNTSGPDIGGSGSTFDYSLKVKEINQMFEAGMGYTDRAGRHFQFYYAQNFDGRNTGDKMVYGVYASFPIGGRTQKKEGGLP